MFSPILNQKYTKVIFFKHQNQLCPLSILSHTSGAEFGHSWLALDKVSSREMSGCFRKQFIFKRDTPFLSVRVNKHDYCRRFSCFWEPVKLSTLPFTTLLLTYITKGFAIEAFSLSPLKYPPTCSFWLERGTAKFDLTRFILWFDF